ncbi:MAG TPA: class I SAM-dependent methyltransferase [Tepidisphaeraceae bacterium]|nr:class I SAM-dependent methyltransferase [Tepidisphaeraceae bacterium]
MMLKISPEPDSSLADKLKRYRFYHFIELGNGVSTEGISRLVPQQQLALRQLRLLPLQGKRVLDIGCRDGLFSFEAERLGASEVIGIDNCLSQGAVDVLIPHLRSRVRMHEMNLLHLSPQAFGRFDVIIFSGVLYHLRYPFQALRIIRDLLADDGVLLIETAIWRVFERIPLLYCPTGAESPYESSSVTFFNPRGLIATMASFGFDAQFVDHLFGRKMFRTKGATARSYAGILINYVQRAFPSLAGSIMGSFFIDRGVFRCHKLKGPPPAEFEYWDARHRVHG